MSPAEAERVAFEEREAASEPEELWCPRCGERWLAPTHYGEVVDGERCPCCGELGEAV